MQKRKLKTTSKERTQKKDYVKRVKIAVEGKKPLGKPLPNRFLMLMIKNTIVNGEDE